MRSPATILAVAIPALALGGAWGAQLIGKLYPCEMCHWQRWPHYVALIVGLLALLVPVRPALLLTGVAALLIAASGVIGVMHAGVEYGWWQGFTACTSTVNLSGLSAAERLDAIMGAPLVRCDRAAWSFMGISLAGLNALLSLGGAALIGVLLAQRTVR